MPVHPSEQSQNTFNAGTTAPKDNTPPKHNDLDWPAGPQLRNSSASSACLACAASLPSDSCGGSGKEGSQDMGRQADRHVQAGRQLKSCEATQ